MISDEIKERLPPFFTGGFLKRNSSINIFQQDDWRNNRFKQILCQKRLEERK